MCKRKFEELPVKRKKQKVDETSKNGKLKAHFNGQKLQNKKKVKQSQLRDFFKKKNKS